VLEKLVVSRSLVEDLSLKIENEALIAYDAQQS
jgi:hypothetical protein